MFVAVLGLDDPALASCGKSAKALKKIEVKHQKQIGLWASDSAQLWSSEDGFLLFDGVLYDAPDSVHTAAPAQDLWQGMSGEGSAFLSRLNGDFTVLYWHAGTQESIAAIDKMGVGRLFYRPMDDALVVGSHLMPVAAFGKGKPEIHRDALLKYLLFNYNPGESTFFDGVSRLRQGHALIKNRENWATRAYWRLHFSPDTAMTEGQAAELIRDGLSKAVKQRMVSMRKPGAFLSGGLDSSSVVSLLSRHGAEHLSTFSFRCRGESFDESPFARMVAESVGADMQLVEYGAQEALLAREMVGFMEEPFSDVGINVATYLLAKNAAGKVGALFTGDGGDELFAGHPVYTADNAAKITDRLPRPLLWPLLGLGAILPDSDKKKDWRVKIKRFAESSAYPAALGTHRWRVYYTPKTLKKLIDPAWLEGLEPDDLLADLIAYNREGEGADSLSRSLYSDYQTAVQFYMRRMDMARGLGLSPRFPMLDADLSALCARVPSHLKIRGMSDTKYIERIAVEPLLPHDVVHRKDKLGHSIPMKNWMRDNETVIAFMRETLLDGSLSGRGWFNMQRVEAMIAEHQARKTNHSHRIWSLMVLELWLRHHLDDLA